MHSHGRGDSCAHLSKDADLRAALGSRLFVRGAEALMPSDTDLRCWFDELATDGDTSEQDAADADEDATIGRDTDDTDYTTARAAQVLPGRRLTADGVRILLTRVCAHVDAALSESPELVDAARRRLVSVIDDAVAEVGTEGVHLRHFHDNALGCIFEAYAQLLVRG